MTMSETAIQECVAELRAACRRPIDQVALDTVVGWMRPNFERILNRLDGGKRWADFGQRLRDGSRHLGALADFFAHHADAPVVRLDQLTQASTLMRADCTTKAQRTGRSRSSSATAPRSTFARPKISCTRWRRCELERRAG